MELSLVGNAVAGFFIGWFGYLFLVTRGTLISRTLIPAAKDKSHIYWIYSNKGLIRFSDNKPFVSAVLLFQYDRLANQVLAEFRRTSLRGKKVLVTSCPFGDVIPKVVRASVEGGARQIVITDLIRNELNHVGRKLAEYEGKFELAEADATCMKLKDGAFDLNLVYFLFHELPDQAKDLALREAARMVAPGGKLIIAEFHQPTSRLLRVLGRIYFTVFEPYALAMWKRYDPVRFIEAMEGWTAERNTFFFGNFQVVVATKKQ